MNTVAGLPSPERFVLAQGPQLNEVSRVHDNPGDGITLGGDPTPASGLCAILPAGLGCGAVDAIVQNTLVYANQQGIVVQEQDADQSATVPILFRNTITENTATDYGTLRAGDNCGSSAQSRSDSDG